MNKQIIIIVILALLVLVALYAIYRQNQKWAGQILFNEAILGKFPDLKIASSPEKQLAEKITDVADKLKEKADAMADETLQEDIETFCQRIKGMERLEDADDIQFYNNNTERIETELKRIHSLENPKKRRHGKDCTCELCQSKKNKPNTSEQ